MPEVRWVEVQKVLGGCTSLVQSILDGDLDTAHIYASLLKVSGTPGRAPSDKEDFGRHLRPCDAAAVQKFICATFPDLKADKSLAAVTNLLSTVLIWDEVASFVTHGAMLVCA